MLMFDRKQQNSVKQLSFNKKNKLIKRNNENSTERVNYKFKYPNNRIWSMSVLSQGNLGPTIAVDYSNNPVYTHGLQKGSP